MSNESNRARVEQAAEAFRHSDEWLNTTYDNVKIIESAEGRPVLVARRHDDHTKWDEIAR